MMSMATNIKFQETFFSVIAMVSTKSALFCLLQILAFSRVWGGTLYTISTQCLLNQAEPPYDCNITSGTISRGKFTPSDNELIKVTRNHTNPTDLHVNIKIAQLPSGLSKAFPKLMSINATACGIKSVTQKHFKDLGSIRSLRLNDNEINELPADVFTDLTNMNWISLARNHIKVLPPSLFVNCKRLDYIDAGKNLIEVLPRDLFANNLKLSMVTLSNNRLKSIEIDFTKFPEIFALDVENNSCVDAVFYRGKQQMVDFQKMVKQKC